MSRLAWQLRDAALGYASRGIPVLPLHYPLPHRSDLQPVTDDRQLPSPAVGTRCSCRDPGCSQVGKHPLGSLVPHGVNDATTNRARIAAWWTQHPHANIGLATGHAFDVLDIDGPTGAKTIRAFAGDHHLKSSGPLVRTGRGGTTTFARPGSATPARPAWRMSTGGARAAMWSPHPAATRPASPTSGSSAVISTPHPVQFPRCCSSGSSPGNSNGRPVPSSSRPPATAPLNATAGPPWPKSWPASPPPRWASATASCGNRPATSTTWSPPAPSTTARSTKDCFRRPSAAGCSPRNRARPAAPWPLAAKSAWPTPAAPLSPPAPTAPTPRRPCPLGRPTSEPRKGGDDHGHRRPPSRPIRCWRGGRVPPPSRARAYPNHPQEGVPGWVATPP
jgi:hypothetical protein